MEKDVCSICTEEILGAEIRSKAILKCGHEFHLDCIGSVFNYSKSMKCPNCRMTEAGNWVVPHPTPQVRQDVPVLRNASIRRDDESSTDIDVVGMEEEEEDHTTFMDTSGESLEIYLSDMLTDEESFYDDETDFGDTDFGDEDNVSEGQSYESYGHASEERFVDDDEADDGDNDDDSHIEMQSYSDTYATEESVSGEDDDEAADFEILPHEESSDEIDSNHDDINTDDQSYGSEGSFDEEDNYDDESD